MTLTPQRFILRRETPSILMFVLILCVCALCAQTPPTGAHSAPKYDLKTEAETTGVVDEVKLIEVGERKDFVELIVKSGETLMPVFACPKPFEDEMGITFSKGDKITITGSKVKQEVSDIILARSLVKGTDTLMFRDDKGNPVWDWRTGK